MPGHESRSTHTILMLLAAWLALPVAWAQQPNHETALTDAQVRFTLRNGNQGSGNLVAWDTLLVIDDGSGYPYQKPRAQVAKLELREVCESKAPQGAGIGALAGLISGAVIGAVTGQESCGSWDYFCYSPESGAVALGLLGAGVGATIGATVGGIMGADQWVTVYPEPIAGIPLRWEVNPGVRVGVGMNPNTGFAGAHLEVRASRFRAVLPVVEFSRDHGSGTTTVAADAGLQAASGRSGTLFISGEFALQWHDARTTAAAFAVLSWIRRVGSGRMGAELKAGVSELSPVRAALTATLGS